MKKLYWFLLVVLSPFIFSCSGGQWSKPDFYFVYDNTNSLEERARLRDECEKVAISSVLTDYLGKGTNKFRSCQDYAQSTAFKTMGVDDTGKYAAAIREVILENYEHKIEVFEEQCIEELNWAYYNCLKEKTKEKK